MQDINYIRLLAEFTSGQLDLPAFRERLDDLLFELRQSPAMTPERRDLSTIQLYLHEMEEGLREQFEVYALACWILDSTVGMSPRALEPRIDIYNLPPAPRDIYISQGTLSEEPTKVLSLAA